MHRQSRIDDSLVQAEDLTGKLPAQAIVTVVAGIAAAWIAADSCGFLGHALRHALTCLVAAVAVVAAWPDRAWKNWAIMAAGIVGFLAFNASTLATLNVLGVVLLLATLAHIKKGLTSRAILLAALAAMTLALFRLALSSIPIVWQLADVLGWSMGRIVGAMTGRPLTVGATFAGLDFLVLMTALYVGWICNIAPPRRRAGIYAAAAIALAYLVYLLALAHSEKIASLLPEPFYVPETDISRIGAWAWQNTARSFFPWNLPLLAMVLEAIVAACMFRMAEWLPVAGSGEEESLSKYGKDDVIELRAMLDDAVFKLGPPALAVLIAMLAALSLSKSDLKGKTVVAYDKGKFSWLKPEYDNPIEGGYGMLPVFVNSLGGSFIRSPDLSPEELAKADVLVLLHPNSPFTSKQLKDIEDYVRRGGSLLLGAENYFHEDLAESHFNDVLGSTSMIVRYDTVVPLAANWEQSYQTVSHPATLGPDDLRNRFGSDRGAPISLGWPARPIVLGRWAWGSPGSYAVKEKSPEYQEGQALGDLVLAAEQPLGKGRIVVLGDMACLNNERLTCSWDFAGRLLGYLANRASSPQDGWRQLSTAAAIILLLAALAIRPDAFILALTSLALAASLVFCAYKSDASSRPLPSGQDQSPNRLAYIDASHLEAFSDDLWDDYGIAGFSRVLMRSGFLPLRLPELTPERLERAGLLVLMAPGRQLSPEELSAVGQFVNQGGTLVCLVGAEQVRPSAALLGKFGFEIDPSPVKPGESIREPDPFGALSILFGRPNDPKIEIQMYAAWPIENIPQSYKTYITSSIDGKSWPIIARSRIGQGVVLVIADTYFAINRNLESATQEFPAHINFWRMLLKDNVGEDVQESIDIPMQERGPAE
jgi:hypothetical protein